MTLTDECDPKQVEEQTKQAKTVGEILQEVVGQALEQGRLTCGVHDCTQLLQIDPFNVMLCVLPDSSETSEEASSQICQMLIEAFCREYDIRLIKVDSLPKLAKIAQGRTTPPDNTVKVDRPSSLQATADVSCLVVQYPDDETSEEDESLAEFYKSVTFGDPSSTCLVSLPD